VVRVLPDLGGTLLGSDGAFLPVDDPDAASRAGTGRPVVGVTAPTPRVIRKLDGYEHGSRSARATCRMGIRLWDIRCRLRRSRAGDLDPSQPVVEILMGRAGRD
jgi:hypothetical protein